MFLLCALQTALNIFHQMSFTKNSFSSYLYKSLHLVMVKQDLDGEQDTAPTFEVLTVEGNKHTIRAEIAL